jgi:hypothetical protein
MMGPTYLKYSKKISPSNEGFDITSLNKLPVGSMSLPEVFGLGQN